MIVLAKNNSTCVLVEFGRENASKSEGAPTSPARTLKAVTRRYQHSESDVAPLPLHSTALVNH